MSIHIRRAAKGDLAFLVEYSCKMAWETEHKRLDQPTVERATAAVFEDPQKGFYLVAEMAGEVIGQLMITLEWSDWRDGWIWWIQSVYVRADARRKGVFRALYAEVIQLAKEQGNVRAVRLYVEKDNNTAQRTYSDLGMKEMPYLVFEKSLI
jgi:ribosomal protein S18 acetylase RimI-like enzyme